MASKLLYKFSGTLTAILITASLLGCTASPATSESVATATLPVCQPSEIQTSEMGFSEIQGTMSSEGEVWALLFFDKAQAEKELKIVWKITGAGEPFSVQGKHEDGTVVSPVWGPEVHEGSNWNRPGDEWGTGFNFPKPGCWMLTATRGTMIGEIGLEVLPP